MNQSQIVSIDIQKELKALYKQWPDMKHFMKSMGCNAADAEDIFQEALLVYTRRLNDPNFELTVHPFHYVKNTCKYLWYNQARKEGKIQSSEWKDEHVMEEEDEWFQKEMKLRSIENALSKIGSQCQQLLRLFYGLGWSMADVAKKLGMRNDKVAKAQKYRCIHKVKEQLGSDTNNSQLI